ncbi:MAG: phage tail protein, partial [Kingella denitrificans]
MQAIETGDRLFHDGNGTTELGTILPAWWLNQVQAEILAVLADAEIEPNKADTAQLKAAIKAMIDNGLGGAVKTSGNQDIGGNKTFTGLATLKKGAIVADSEGDFNANQWLQIGANNVNSYFYNKKSGKYLSMRNDGELRYDGKRLLNTDDLLGIVPSGTVLYFAGQTAPAGWLKANGAAVSRTAYAALFAAIGTTYGLGDGRSTFNLPDLRGEFLRGWDDGRGVDSPRPMGSAQTDAVRQHYHGIGYISPNNDDGAFVVRNWT